MPQPPMEYMGCQVQGDIALLDQRGKRPVSRCRYRHLSGRLVPGL
ncbi:hypothetical protein [Thiomicrorhabdus sp.]